MAGVGLGPRLLCTPHLAASDGSGHQVTFMWHLVLRTLGHLMSSLACCFDFFAGDWGGIPSFDLRGLCKYGVLEASD